MQSDMLPCKPWTGTILSTGYGRAYKDGVRQMAHRWVWEQENGDIPAGMHVMHICDNPPCVEITHLRLGSPKENFQDSIAKGRNYYKNRTHCPKGHPYDEENTRLNQRGHRGCKSCDREVKRAIRARRRVEKQAAAYEAGLRKRAEEIVLLAHAQEVNDLIEILRAEG